MFDSTQLRGLYVITDHELAVRHQQTLVDMVAAALRGGARIVQYRDKSSDHTKQIHEATQLQKLCAKHQAIFLINDDVELALTCHAHGVHLGQTDTTLAYARQQLGPDKLIGISCHGDLSLALKAQQQSADYIALGRFFDSKTKPHAPPTTIDTLKTVRAQIRIPIVAIGGVTPKNAPTLIEAGADMLAAIAGVFGADDIEHAAREYTELFRTLS